VTAPSGSVPIEVTARDTASGESGTQTIADDYCLITAGTCEVTNVQIHANGTHVVTIKGVKR
jgi:hypothetical protein